LPSQPASPATRTSNRATAMFDGIARFGITGS
jgi:hypothetical protein